MIDIRENGMMRKVAFEFETQLCTILEVGKPILQTQVEQVAVRYKNTMSMVDMTDC